MKKRATWWCPLALAAALTGTLALAGTEVEPGMGQNGSGGGAAVQSATGSEAVIQLSFHAMTQPATATITPQSLTEKGELLGLAAPVRTVALPAGVESSLVVPVRVNAGKLNNLNFQITLAWPNGTTSELSYFVQVNLDPSREPKLVGNVLEFKADEVKP